FAILILRLVLVCFVVCPQRSPPRSTPFPYTTLFRSHQLSEAAGTLLLYRLWPAISPSRSLRVDVSVQLSARITLSCPYFTFRRSTVFMSDSWRFSAQASSNRDIWLMLSGMRFVSVTLMVRYSAWGSAILFNISQISFITRLLLFVPPGIVNCFLYICPSFVPTATCTVFASLLDNLRRCVTSSTCSSTTTYISLNP